MGSFEIRMKAFLHYDMAMRVYESHGVKCGGLNKNVHIFEGWVICVGH